MLKRTFSFVLMLLLMTLVLSCGKKSKDYSSLANMEPPKTEKSSGEYNLDFVSMHNFVIDYVTESELPFFFVKEGQFDISGDNEKKQIKLTCECIKGTTIEDVDLFLSIVLNGIGLNAAEQDYRFKSPSVQEGAYVDFGTVFNTYSLEIDAKNEDGTVLRNIKIGPGQRIPVDPRYILE